MKVVLKEKVGLYKEKYLSPNCPFCAPYPIIQKNPSLKRNI